jgi:hypothetical protein
VAHRARALDVSTAYPLVGLGFGLTMVGEWVDIARMLGVKLTYAGVKLVGWS